MNSKNKFYSVKLNNGVNIILECKNKFEVKLEIDEIFKNFDKIKIKNINVLEIIK